MEKPVMPNLKQEMHDEENLNKAVFLNAPCGLSMSLLMHRFLLCFLFCIYKIPHIIIGAS